MSSIEARPAPSNAARAAVAAALVIAMCLFGFGVYHAAALFKAGTTHVQLPTESHAPVLPGTMYVEQAGAIYRLNRGAFRQITSSSGWTQVSVSPDGGRLVAVKRSLNWSDIYILAPTGRTLLQLTHDQSPTVEANHWAFYPRFTSDSSLVFFSYDPKDPYNSYRVDLAILATSAHNPSVRTAQWTYPNEYTGGDVDPIPLRAGGLMFTRFSIDDQANVHSQLWLQSRPGTPGVALTKAADDCGQPSVSKNETQVAMVCRHGGLQSADLEIATLDVAAMSLGTPAVLVHGELVAAPAFSPDGKLLAYFAPADDRGPFQLWTVEASAASHAAPRQVSTNLDLDPTSAPAWSAG